jgi:hypothetical protein
MKDATVSLANLVSAFKAQVRAQASLCSARGKRPAISCAACPHAPHRCVCYSFSPIFPLFSAQPSEEPLPWNDRGELQELFGLFCSRFDADKQTVLQKVRCRGRGRALLPMRCGRGGVVVRPGCWAAPASSSLPPPTAFPGPWRLPLPRRPTLASQRARPTPTPRLPHPTPALLQGLGLSEDEAVEGRSSAQSQGLAAKRPDDEDHFF